MSHTNFRLLVLGILCLPTVYLFSALVFRKFKPIHLSRALLYISSVAMIGVLGEISVDSAYAHFFGAPLWRYNYLPIHHAYTSAFSPILWGSFGFYLYLMHHQYERWRRKELIKLAFIFSLEAIAIEAIADLISKIVLEIYLLLLSIQSLAYNSVPESAFLLSLRVCNY